MHMKSPESKKTYLPYLPPLPHALCPHLKSPQTSNNSEKSLEYLLWHRKILNIFLLFSLYNDLKKVLSPF